MLIDGTVAREALVQLLFESQPDNERQSKRSKNAPTIDLEEIQFPIQIGTLWSDLLDNCGPMLIDRNLQTRWSTEALTIGNEQFTKARMTIIVDNRNLPVADNEILVRSTDDSNVFLALARAGELQHVQTPVSIHIEGKRVEARIVVRMELDRSSKSIFALFNVLYPSKMTAPSNTSFEEYLRHLQPPTSDQFLDAYQSDALVPKLAPFQSQNVEWMLAREGHRVVNGNVECTGQTNDVSPFLYEKVVLNSGRTVHVNRITRELVVDSTTPEFVQAQALTQRGGVLADEMGLGKTVCAIALILLHKFNPNDRTHPRNMDGLAASGATLIITPSAIIRQWEAEFERHAPALRVKTYRGIKATRDNEPITHAELAQYDVVLTDYTVLQEEIYHARVVPDRPRRHAAKYPIKRSPLVEILWLRVMLDEAQMVESSMALVAEMARLIPRWYSWGVTGTPMKSSFDDLFGLLLFLGFTPSIRRYNIYKQLYAQNAPSWTKGLFWDFSRTIIRRNIKAALASQIHIPPQHRNIVKITFSAIEQHYYQSLWEQCSRSTNLPQLDAINWSPTDDLETSPAEIQRTLAKLRTWLLSLRQACVHPTIGSANKKRVIHQAVRTLAEVLDALLRQAKDDIDNTSANLINCRLKRAGMAEVEKQWQDALDIYLSAVPKILDMIDSVNQRIQDTKAQQSEEETDDDDRRKKSTEPLQEYITNLHNRHHKWISYLHRSFFFIAGMYHELGQEKEEAEYYDKAAATRRQILSRAEERVTASKREVPRTALVMHGEIGPSEENETLVLSFDRLDRINVLCATLDSQLSHINKWRAALSGLLCSSLVDHNEEHQDVTGDEYEASLITQEKLDLYQDAYQAMLRDRNFWVNGVWATGFQQSDLFKDLARSSESEEINALQVELSQIRQKHMPEAQTRTNLRTLIAELREILGHPLTNSIEKQIIRKEHDRLNMAASKQRELQDRLEIEYRRFTQLYNHRIEYYRALQELSDHVMPWQSRNPAFEARQLSRDEASFEKALKEQSARCRYLENLLKEKNEKERKCLICQSGFSKGLMTYCGHMFCHECATIWLRLHHRCPQCNTPVKLQECYAIAWDKSIDNQAPESSESPNDQDVIDADQEISTKLMEQIDRCEIVEGLGAKLDSIIRHIKYIIATSNGKSVVFSQWKDVLNLIADGLTKNGINFVRVDKTVRDDRIKQFREDPDIHVILLHARSQSSGLTLICAQTVFIVEPVLNEALERQAISRVHRIGQTKETNVYWYIVQETIEERIHAIYSARHRRKIRMDLIDDSTVLLATQSEGGGERVSDEDLKRCFTSNEYSALSL
ncbi:SNF2 family N-terminal domain-containing protein [Fennellomyces sp. T-0311]|nr:SNF2 family N-terminal domain-containing protein [Fennellomyces sp. T-0311]